MKQVEKLAKQFADRIVIPFQETEDSNFRKSMHDCLESGFIEGFNHSLELVTTYLHYQHRLGTLNEYDISFEEIQSISDLEVE